MLNVEKIIINKTNTGPRRKKAWDRQISDTKTTRKKRKCRQQPLMAICTRPCVTEVRAQHRVKTKFSDKQTYR